MNHTIMSGQRFGRLTTIKKAESSSRNPRWICICECGTVKSYQTSSLYRGLTKSCGCLQKELLTTHGCFGTSEHKTWSAMIQRCHNPKSQAFKNYGGRGITVCERWRIAANFLEDMGPRPEGMTLERINNDRGYEPGNCKWATPTEQARNTRVIKLTKHQVHRIREFLWAGASQKELAILFSVNPSTISQIHRRITWK